MTELLPDQMIDEDRFRRTLALHAAGVVVVTAACEGVPVGLTATSFSSVSLSPPLVSFYVDQGSTTWPSLRRAERFAVNILEAGQADVAARFARRGVDRFAAPLRWRPHDDGTPLLDGVCAHLLCVPHTTMDIGDHILVVGLVTSAGIHESDRPLLYHRGRFGRFHALDG
ncbi:flavin-dependent reductase [Actinomadura rubrobrunea]|uniref:Flavin-dependent reductase n=1 Tax=Actinomadura rubrobrunea TaxID=115335 RepID=A0A9W6PYM4_9ACTN|nr:flavin reductase family protein [Actinomadura rubrobrunea]GLW65346.1 flavin-dependent reductase [Actinomadura rubrobrunea]